MSYIHSPQGGTMSRTHRQTARAPLDTYANRIIDEEVFLCQTRDISRHSIRLRRVLEPARDAKKVSLEFQLPTHKEVIWAHGEVVREPGEDGVVVKFLAMADGHRRLIDGYVRQARRDLRRAARVR
jgi:hypothetical protein